MEVLREILSEHLLLYKRFIPNLNDLEGIRPALTSEYTVVNSKNHFFRMHPSSLSSKIENSVCNCKHRKLFLYIETSKKGPKAIQRIVTHIRKSGILSKITTIQSNKSYFEKI